LKSERIQLFLAAEIRGVSYYNPC